MTGTIKTLRADKGFGFIKDSWRRVRAWRWGRERASGDERPPDYNVDPYTNYGVLDNVGGVHRLLDIVERGLESRDAQFGYFRSSHPPRSELTRMRQPR